MDNESCDVGLQKDEKYGWKLKIKGNCAEVLKDINEKLGEYGCRYFEDRLIIVPPKKTETSSEQTDTEES